MGQQLLQWRSGDGEKLWLSMLVDTMERVSRREVRSRPCDQSVLVELQAHLARPTWLQAHCASDFSLRN